MKLLFQLGKKKEKFSNREYNKFDVWRNDILWHPFPFLCILYINKLMCSFYIFIYRSDQYTGIFIFTFLSLYPILHIHFFSSSYFYPYCDYHCNIAKCLKCPNFSYASTIYHSQYLLWYKWGNVLRGKLFSAVINISPEPLSSVSGPRLMYFKREITHSCYINSMAMLQWE